MALKLSAQQKGHPTRAALFSYHGIIYFDGSTIQTGKAMPEKIIVSVKTGENVIVDHNRSGGNTWFQLGMLWDAKH